MKGGGISVDQSKQRSEYSKQKVHYPVTTGHEFAGYVHQVGSEVKIWKPGDRVTADNAVPCGKCYFCQREMYSHCLNFQSVGHSIPGGFAQYVKVKDNSVFRIPKFLK